MCSESTCANYKHKAMCFSSFQYYAPPLPHSGLACRLVQYSCTNNKWCLVIRLFSD